MQVWMRRKYSNHVDTNLDVDNVSNFVNLQVGGQVFGPWTQPPKKVNITWGSNMHVTLLQI